MMRRARHALVALVVAGAAGLLLASTAHALVPETITSNSDDIAAWLYRGGAQDSSVTPRCGAVCSDLWLQEHRPMPNQPSSSLLHRELSHLRWKMGLRATFKALPVIGMGVASFDLGWSIGTGLRRLFIEGDEAPPQPSVPPAQKAWRMVPFARGDLIGGGGSLLWHVTMTAPSDGWVLSDPDGWQLWFDTPGFERNANCSYFQGASLPAPPGFTVVTRGGDATGCMSGGPQVHMVFKPAPAIPPSETFPPGSWPAGYNVGAQPNLANATSLMLRELNEKPDDYRTLIPYLDATFGGPSDNPVWTGYVGGETCLGATAAACRAELEALGFQDVAVHTLAFENAATGIAGSTVVGLYSEGKAAIVPAFDPAVVTLPEDYPVLPVGTVVPAVMPATIPPPAQTQPLRLDKPIVILVNPAPAEMPVRVLAPLPHETSDAYVQRLQAKGLLGRVEVVADSETNLDYGPNEVIRLTPEPGTRVRTGSEVVVRTNPSSAPAPGPGPAGQCGLTPPSSAFDLSPITTTGLGTKVPFSLLPFVGTSIGGLASPGAPPNVTVRVFGATADLSFLESFNDVIGLFRLIETILLWIGVAWFLYGRTIGKAG